ncbi:MAG TPA: hypothetical protein VMV13_05300 [Candidatus Binataceae bacterium]|nr:hypothetical protein [Candidatus Binataceae bacterium]
MPHPNSLANLRPWQPGTSPNPNGRPRDASLINYVLRNSEGGHELGEILLTIARNPSAKGSDRISAISILLDRLYGKVALSDRAALLDEAAAPAQRINFHVILGPDRGIEEIEAVRTNDDATTHNEIEALDGDTAASPASVDGD